RAHRAYLIRQYARRAFKVRVRMLSLSFTMAALGRLESTSSRSPTPMTSHSNLEARYLPAVSTRPATTGSSATSPSLRAPTAFPDRGATPTCGHAAREADCLVAAQVTRD